MLPVDLGKAVCLKLDVRCRTEGLFILWRVFRLMIGPLDPVTSKLGQQDEWEGTAATQHLTKITQ